MRMHDAIRAGQEVEKPGWVRLNFSVLMDDAKVAYILKSVNELAENASVIGQSYLCDTATARFKYQETLAAE
ncbi:Cysteine desulfurase [Acetobacter malorum]|nr:Cysteine desulfurase [Acetobacter malorum]OAG78688.1 Cysteine desulfurase [Acetobacter malorum]